MGSLTLQRCFDAAAAAGWHYFGLQWSIQCFAGNNLTLATSLGIGTCNMACSGNSSQICGGDGSQSIYEVPFVGDCVRACVRMHSGGQCTAAHQRHMCRMHHGISWSVLSGRTSAADWLGMMACAECAQLVVCMPAMAKSCACG